MAIAAEALLRLKAVLDDEGFRKAEGALKGLDNQAKRTGGTVGGKLNRPLQAAADGMETVGRQARRAAVGGLVATGAGLTYAGVQASNFEDSLSDIKKALGLKVSSPQFAQLSDDFLKLSRNVPVAASDLAELGGMAALAGKDSRQEILKFASDAAKLGVAFRMPGKEAAESLLAIQAQLGTTDQATLDLMGTVNRLSDVFPGKVDARDILKGFQSGLGGAGKMAGMTGEQTAGFYSAFLAAGTPADAAATAMKNFLNSLTSGTSLSKEKQSALGELYGMPVDPARKQLQDELRQVNDDLVEFGGNARADAIEKLIEDARFQGKKLIEFEGQTLNLTQAGILKKRLNEGNSDITKGLKARKKAIEDQLKTMPSAGGMVAADLAKRMQADPVGTIMDVLQRIKQLPKDRQVGVVNDIFGKESQLGIAAILSNIGLVKQGFNVAAQATQNADSWLKEYNSQLENTSSQFQLLKNAFNEMAIRIGTAMLPVLTQAMKDLTPTIIELIPPMVELVKAALPLLVSGLKAAVPYLQQFAAWAKANPEKLREIVTNTVKFGAGLIALGVAAGTLRNLATVFKVLSGFGGKIKGLADLPRTIAGTLGAVGPMLQKLKGLGGGGGGFFGGIVTAAKGLAGRVMGPIKGLVGMIRIAFAGLTFRELFPGLANRLQQLKNTVAGIFGKGGASKALSGAANNIRPTVLRPVNTIKPFTRIPPVANPMPWLGSIGTALARLGPLLLGFGSTVARVFMGPVGWVTLLIGAGVALYAFRNQIGQFLASVGPALAGVFAPLRNLAGGLMTAISTSLANLGTMLAPVWAQIATAFRTYVVTPIQQVWNFLVVWIGQTIAAYAIVWWQGVVQNFNQYVVQPIQAAWNFLLQGLALAVQGLATVWAGISQAFNVYVVVPVQTAWNGLVMFFGQGVAYLQAILSQVWAGVSAAFVQWVVTPITQGWNQLTSYLGGATGPLRNALNSAWQGVAQNFSTYVVQPVSSLWNGLSTFVGNAAGGMVRAFQGAWANVAGAVRNGVIVPLQNMFDGLASRVRSVFDGLLGWARGIANWAVNTVNNVRQRAAQGFAKGGYVNGPTLGLIGEGRDPREYIIPERKMAGAAMNYLNGKRGASVLSGVPRFAGGGFVDTTRSKGKKRKPMQEYAFYKHLNPKEYAKGGYVNKPTLGLIGEAGDNEYVVPERKMAASAMAFLSGARGMDVINPPRFANGGVVGGSMANRSGNLNALLERTGAIGGQTVVVQDPTINATIQVQTGDVLQFEGQQYVTLSDYQRGLKQVQSETLGLLRTAQGRRATGR